RSPPAQNALSPAPVNTTARASASRASASKHASRSSPIAVFIALCCSGRFKTTVTTWRSSERVTRRWRYTGFIVAGLIVAGHARPAWTVDGLSLASPSLHHALRLEIAYVVEGVAEPGEHVRGMLAEQRGHATHARSPAVPANRQADGAIVRQPRMRRRLQHAARRRLRLLEDAVDAEDRRRGYARRTESLEQVGGLEPLRERRDQ